jgi:hypothetical protein
MLKLGTSVGLTGYTLEEKGYEGETPEESIETEHLPGFLLNTVQVGVGVIPSSRLYVAFAPGIWFDESFSRFAFTPASLLAKYALFPAPVTPTVNLQGGIFIEQPVSAFGFFLNPAVGVEFYQSGDLKWYADCGYLLTSWTLLHDFVDTTDKVYETIHEDIRHSISISTGITF